MIKGPPDLSYCDILNLATDEAMAEDAKKKRNPIRPSGAGGCTRELAYKLMEFTGQAHYGDKPISAELNRIFSAGHALEYDIIKQFRKHTSDIFQVRYTQQSLWFEKILWPTREDLHMTLEGSNDLVFWSDEWKCVVDIKTKKDKFSSWMKTQWDELTLKLSEMKTVQVIGDTQVGFWVEDIEAFLVELDDPFFGANFVQLNLYATNEEFVKREIDHACIIQYNKNDQRLREIRFLPSLALAEKTKAKFHMALLAADQGDPEIAPRDYMLGSIKCAFCDFKGMCWPTPTDPSEDPLKLYFKNLPKKYWAKKLEDFDDELQADLRKAYEAYRVAESSTKELKSAETELARLMLQEANTWKLKFDDGIVLQAKELKTPRPHITVRKGKE